ncbi:MAG: acetoacetate decarboxylase family protein [bacterium]
MSEFFDGVKQWEFDWEGRKGKLPVFYYDNTTLNAIFTASTRAVKPLLPHQDMRPIELFPGRCLAAFTCFEYRKTDIDPYNEVSVSFPITFGKPSIPGLTAAFQMARRHFTTFVWQLPVTTEVARVGGVELYGYPKFLADIDFVRDARTIRCDLSENGDKILSLEGAVLPTQRGGVNRYVSYTIKDDIPLAVNVYQNPIELGQSRRRGDARLSLGTSHPIAAALGSLKLSDHPILYQYCPVNEAILFAGRNLIDD